jgi:Lrp/AsnC family transcriptional regulator, regulator for asnA, asnC and gidA
MDEVDKQIIGELAKDARMAFSRIAKEIGVSTETVRKRYQRMKKEGTIIRSTIVIDLSKIGYEGKTILKITNTPNHDIAVTMDLLSKMPDIFLSKEVLGDADALAIAPFKDLKSTVALINNLKKAPSVDRVEISNITNTFFPVTKDFNKLLRCDK